MSMLVRKILRVDLRSLVTFDVHAFFFQILFIFVAIKRLHTVIDAQRTVVSGPLKYYRTVF